MSTFPISTTIRPSIEEHTNVGPLVVYALSVGDEQMPEVDVDIHEDSSVTIVVPKYPTDVTLNTLMVLTIHVTVEGKPSVIGVALPATWTFREPVVEHEPDGTTTINIERIPEVNA